MSVSKYKFDASDSHENISTNIYICTYNTLLHACVSYVVCESVWVLLVVHMGCRLVTVLFSMLQWCVYDVSLEPGH